MLCLVNKERSMRGLHALGQSHKLDMAALRHSRDQARRNHISHEGSNGSSPSDRASDVGYNWARVAENVAYGYDNEGQCMRHWMKSYVDAGFCRSSAANHMNLDTQLSRILFGQTKQMATEDRPAFGITRRMERRRCTHKQPIAGSDCIAEIIGKKNEFNYCVASQDYALREKLRLVPGVPLIYEKRSVLIVEPVSAATQLAAQKNEHKKQMAPKSEKDHIKKALDAVKLENRNGQTAEEAAAGNRPNKRKRPKAPNPLAVKKKKTTTATTTTTASNKSNSTTVNHNDHNTDDGTKRRRQRKPYHYKNTHNIVRTNISVTVSYTGSMKKKVVVVEESKMNGEGSSSNLNDVGGDDDDGYVDVVDDDVDNDHLKWITIRILIKMTNIKLDE
ncbi:Fcf1-domain-containing protein [Syncephalis plumigaleata]|nr:Fcf1-domain-containing protein [Syncephalis plumigaleata]